LFDKDTATIDFIDGPNGPILCLDQRDSKTDEQICLYRYKYDHESSFDSDYEQSSKSILLSREDNIYHTAFKLETSLSGEVNISTLLQSPTETAVILDMIPACVLISINRMARLSNFQLASLSLFILKSSDTSLWQRESSFNIRLIDNTIDRIDQQYSNEDDGDSVVMVQEHDDNRTNQEKQNPKFIDDYDQSTIKKNLIDHFEPNDEENSHDLHSRTMLKSNLSIDQQKITSNIKSNKIRSISDTINRRSIFNIEGIESNSILIIIYL
jgi:hypothetical protein